MSYLTQMAGLRITTSSRRRWASAVAVGLIRAISGPARHHRHFWVDTTRSLLYVLLRPPSLALCLMVAQGVPQNLHAYTSGTYAGGQTQNDRAGPCSLAGSHQDAGHQRRRILNANSAHLENPTPGPNLFQMFLIFVIPQDSPIRWVVSPGHPAMAGRCWRRCLCSCRRIHDRLLG